jgi:hypothetical protein
VKRSLPAKAYAWFNLRVQGTATDPDERPNDVLDWRLIASKP